MKTIIKTLGCISLVAIMLSCTACGVTKKVNYSNGIMEKYTDASCISRSDSVHEFIQYGKITDGKPQTKSLFTENHQFVDVTVGDKVFNFCAYCGHENSKVRETCPEHNYKYLGEWNTTNYYGCINCGRVVNNGKGIHDDENCNSPFNLSDYKYGEDLDNHYTKCLVCGKKTNIEEHTWKTVMKNDITALTLLEKDEGCESMCDVCGCVKYGEHTFDILTIQKGTRADFEEELAPYYKDNANESVIYYVLNCSTCNTKVIAKITQRNNPLTDNELKEITEQYNVKEVKDIR